MQFDHILFLNLPLQKKNTFIHKKKIKNNDVEDGVKGFYRGLMPSVLAIIPLSGIFFLNFIDKFLV